MIKFILGVLFSISFQAANAANFNKELTALVKNAEDAQLAAPTYQDWNESEFHPEAIARQLVQKSQQPGFTQALCQFLKTTTQVDLFYFSEYLEQNQIPCLVEQQQRYQSFLSYEQIKISSRIVTAQSAEKPKTLGPSEEVIIDAKETPVIFDGHLAKKTLALTFDDGPHATRTPQLLQLLANENLQVNFFLVGRNSTLYPDLIKQENTAGHEVGCHSYTHADLRKLKYDAAVAEIEDGFRAITRALGEPRTMFRFPYGAYTSALRNYLINTETPEFMWNIDTLDWKYKDPSFLIDYALGQVRNEGRGVILFHDIQPQTLAIMPGFLATLKQEGYKMAVFRPSKTRKTP